MSFQSFYGFDRSTSLHHHLLQNWPPFGLDGQDGILLAVRPPRARTQCPFDGEASPPSGAAAPSNPIGGTLDFFKSETKNFENIIRSLNNNFVKVDEVTNM